MSVFVSGVPSKTVPLPDGAGSVVIRKLGGKAWAESNALPDSQQRHAQLCAAIVSWSLPVAVSPDAIADLDDDTCEFLSKEIQVLTKPVLAHAWAAAEHQQAMRVDALKKAVEDERKNDAGATTSV